MMKKIFIFLFLLTSGTLTYSQGQNVEIGLNAPAHGVNIKCGFLGAGGWTRGYRISNQDGTENFIQLGTYGSYANGITRQEYSFLGRAYNKAYLVFKPNGNIGIGITAPNEKLAVNGNIRAKEIKVEATNWPDYVFKQDYELMSLKEVEQHILQHGHLPDVPKAEQIEADGLSLGEMNKLLMKKVEELTLHAIANEKSRRAMEQRIQQLEKLPVKE